MAVSFVNGFLCTCSCDVAKAKRGVDPHQQTDGAQNPTKADTTKNGVVTPDKPAVVFGGSLSGTSTSTDTTVVTPALAAQAGASVNLLV